jgi:Undecaprenyl-phosphate glucose phosphotransferase
MLKRHQHTFGYLYRLTDAGVVVLAWLASYWIRFDLPPVLSFLSVKKGLPDFTTYAALVPLIAALWIVIFTSQRVYESKRLRGLASELLGVLKAHALALLTFIAITYLFEEYRYSRLVVLYFALLAGAGLVLFRIGLRSALRSMRARGFNLRHVLAVGEGAALEHLIERLEAYPELGLRVRGVITDDFGARTQFCGRPIVGRYDDVVTVLRNGGVDEVLIALPPSCGDRLDRLLELLKDETLDVGIVPDVHRYVTLGCEVEEFDGLPVVRINDSPVMGGAALAKRATDATLSAFLLIALSPLLFLIAIVVKLSSKGPVLYAQERMGLDGRKFSMLKFRSMRVDAEATSGAVWCSKTDPRRTRLGTFLRKTSLDELPQLWNVLRGDMSLVGPRPERPVFVEKFRSEIPHYMLRHKVRAGITGWAQVNGWRGDTSLDRRIECDLFYIRNWSYLLDLKILTMTLWRGFINKNAY